MNRWLAFSGLALAALALAALPSGAQSRARSVLESVEELARPTTQYEARIPLGDLVRKVAAETGTPLTTSSEVADEPVCVAVKGVPARDLLNGLAELLDYQWRRRGEGYEISQDLASRRREEELRKALTADLEHRLAESLRSLVQMAELPQDRIDELIREDEEWGRQLQELSPERRQQLLASPSGRANLQRLSQARQLWSPINRTLARLLGRLPADHWALLRKGEVLTLSSEPASGQGPLPAETLRGLRNTEFQLLRSRDFKVKPDPTGRRGDPKEIAQREERSRARWRDASGFQVMLWLDAEETDTLRLIANAYPLNKGVPLSEFSLGENGWVHVETHTYTAKLEQLSKERTPERAEALSQHPVLGVKKLVRLPPGQAARRSDAQILDYLPEVARTFDVPILSDAYSDSILARPVSESTALWSLLDRLAGGHHTWDYQDAQVRIRNRSWFLRRPSEVPRRLIREWQSQVEKHGALTWQQVTAARTTLTPAQRRTMGEIFMERHDLPVDFGGNSSAYAPLLLSRLTTVQRDQLRRGRALPIAALTAAQQTLFLGPLRFVVHYNLRNRLTPISLQDLGAAKLSLRTERLLRTRQRIGEQVRFRDQPAPGGASPAPGQHLVTRVSLDYYYTSAIKRTEQVTVAAFP